MSRCLLIFISLWLWALAAYADITLGQIPIQHAGRVKPLQVFANAMHAQISHYRVTPAESLAWLQETLFRPHQAIEKAIIYMPADTARWLGVRVKPSARYDLKTLLPLLKRHQKQVQALMDLPAADRLPEEQSLLQSYWRIQAYADLLNTFTLLLPFQDPRLQALGTHYLAAVPQLPALLQQTQAALKRYGKSIAHYPSGDARAAKQLFDLLAIRQTGRRSHLFRVIPGQDGEWLSPWSSVITSQVDDVQTQQPVALSPVIKTRLDHWQALANAYLAQDSAQSAERIRQLYADNVDAYGGHDAHLWLEYHFSQIYHDELMVELYLFVSVLCLLGFAFRHSRFERCVAISYGAVLLLQISSIVVRMLVLGRPPVTDLYESILFVSMVVATLGFVIAWRLRVPWVRLITALLAGGLILLASAFDDYGDSFVMPIAVLNTNFWLGTHVVCITIGYAMSLLTGVAGHYVLYRRLAPSRINLGFLALLSLLFMTVGTLLGGIWADQSWGRFWGWDPKENGALLIILWMLWSMHGRLARLLSAAQYVLILSALTVVVALSWFGVNLLSTGLHSYGFTDKTAWGLLGFCLAEVILLGYLYLRCAASASSANLPSPTAG